MLVVSDLEDPFLPQPNDLLCNLSDCRSTLEALLNRLNDMFKDTQNVGNALGPALQSAYKLISPIGGKILCLQASLPNLEVGALKMREDPKLLGTSKVRMYQNEKYIQKVRSTTTSMDHQKTDSLNIGT